MNPFPDPVSPDLFRQALRRWPSGVTVITMPTDDGPHGMTASAFCSVSVAPPQILVVVDQRWRSHDMIAVGGVFCVNILADNQSAWSDRFAGRGRVEDRFAGIATTTAVTGALCLTDACAWLDCRLAAAHDAGDHSIFVGEVLAVGLGGGAEGPLVYQDGAYRVVGERVDPGEA